MTWPSVISHGDPLLKLVTVLLLSRLSEWVFLIHGLHQRQRVRVAC